MKIEIVRNKRPFDNRVWVINADEVEIKDHEISIHVNGSWITFSSNDFKLYSYEDEAHINYNKRYVLKPNDTHEVLAKKLGGTLGTYCGGYTIVVKGGHKWE